MNPETMSHVLVLLNVAAMGAVFVYSACSLSVRQWTARQPDYWIHAMLIGGSIAVIGHTANTWQPHHWTEIMFNVVAAAYFMLRSRRIHLLAGMLGRKGKGGLKASKASCGEAKTKATKGRKK